MKAIVARPGRRRADFQELVEPTSPQPGEVVCRTLELGVCGTDREILESLQPVTPPGADFLVLGHECLGQVEQTGAGVAHLQPGDLVVPVVRRAYPEFAQGDRADMLAFGKFVERGIYLAHGFAAARWTDRPEHLLKVEPRIRDVAVLAEPLAVSEKAVNEALAVQRGRLGDSIWTAPPPRVLVTGQGPIAFTAILACVARGWPTTATGRDAEDAPRADLARRLGADYRPLSRFAPDPVDVEVDGFDLLLECTGYDAVLLDGARWLASCGVAVWLGSTRRPQPELRNLQRLMRDGILRNHLHLATVNSAPRDFTDALQHLAWFHTNRPDALRSLITHRVPCDDALDHYSDRIPQGVKTVVEF